jgi:O-acetyl-ADP-ribose deacetylase (regulator of RNase III)
MKFGSGVCGAIFQKAGQQALEDCTERLYGVSFEHQENAMKPTEIRFTGGFALPCNILFAQSPKRWNYPEDDAESLLLETYENALCGAAEMGYRRVLIPALGTGHYGFTHEETAKKVVDLLKEIVCGDYEGLYRYEGNYYNGQISGIDVKLVLINESTAQIYKKYL